MSELVKVLVEVRGGVVTNVMSYGVELDVIVCDYDGYSDERLDQTFSDGLTAKDLVASRFAKSFY